MNEQLFFFYSTSLDLTTYEHGSFNSLLHPHLEPVEASETDYFGQSLRDVVECRGHNLLRQSFLLLFIQSYPEQTHKDFYGGALQEKEMLNLTGYWCPSTYVTAWPSITRSLKWSPTRYYPNLSGHDELTASWKLPRMVSQMLQAG